MHPSGQDRRLVALLAGSVLGAILIRTAWMSDEAYFTFRTVDNFIHGYGLRWNVAERVQVFTHPLWMLLVTAAYAITREAYFTVLAISAFLTLATMYVVVTRIAWSTAAATAAAAVLILSKAFVDYSTSGLETPLTFLLLALFWAVYFRDEGEPLRSRMLAAIAGLLAVTDITATLLVAPALTVVLWRDRLSRRAGTVVALAPLVVWELFAFFYYGTLLSAPASARLHAGLPSAQLWRHGFVYLLDSINIDPITLTVIGAVAVLAAIGTLDRTRALAIGLALYLLLVVRMGGNAMTGRLLAAPLLCAAIALGRIEVAPLAFAVRVQLFAAVLGLGLMSPRPLTTVRRYADDSRRYVSELSGIADQRHLSFLSTGMLNARRDLPWPLEEHARGGRTARATTPRLVVSDSPGLEGFFAGPLAHVLDPAGRTDSFLARLPAERPWAIGTQRRAIPRGYESGAMSGRDELASGPAVHRLFAQVKSATRDPIWSARRLDQMIQLNFESR